MRTTRREKRLFLAAAALLVAWALYALAYKPAAQRIHTLERVLPEKQAALVDLRHAADAYNALHDQLDTLTQRIAAQPPDFALLPWLESTARECNLRPDAMKPRTETSDDRFTQTFVEIEFSDVDPQPLMLFFTRLADTGVPLVLNDLHLTRNPQHPTRLDVAATITHLAPATN